MGTARIQSYNRFSPQRSDFGKSYHPFVDYSGLLPLTTTSLMILRRFYHSSALISIGGHPLVWSITIIWSLNSHDSISRWMGILIYPDPTTSLLLPFCPSKKYTARPQYTPSTDHVSIVHHSTIHYSITRARRNNNRWQSTTPCPIVTICLRWFPFVVIMRMHAALHPRTIVGDIRWCPIGRRQWSWHGRADSSVVIRYQ